MEAYLRAFEATTTQEQWHKVHWVGLLAPLLSSEALTAIQDLETSAAQDYDTKKFLAGASSLNLAWDSHLQHTAMFPHIRSKMKMWGMKGDE